MQTLSASGREMKQAPVQDAPPADPISETRLRPGERVRSYLEAEFLNQGLPSGTRLPTIREVATRLNVSFPTVQSIYRNLAAEGRLRTEVGNGTFLKNEVKKSEGSQGETMRVALSISVPGELLNVGGPFRSAKEMWCYRLYGGMMYHALQSVIPITITRLAGDELGDVTEEALIEAEPRLDALILFKEHYRTRGDRVREFYRKAHKPIIDYNLPKENATANFVAFDGRTALTRCAQAALAGGRRRFLMLFRSASIENNPTHVIQFQSFLAALRPDQNSQIEIRVAEVGSHLAEAGNQALKKVLAEGYIPDFIFCTGDFLALGALQALEEAGLSIPQDVSVVGGSGFDLENEKWANLTRIRQPLETMGQALLAMAERRISELGVDVPGIFIETSWRGGGTTLPAENHILQLP